MKRTGLTQEEVSERIAKSLVNTDDIKMTETYGTIFRKHILTFFNLINTILLILILFTGEYKNALFFNTVLFNAAVGIYQEIKAKRLLEKMSLMVRDEIEVLRDGEWKKIYSDELVQDDYLKLKSGQQIPVDAVVEEGQAEVNESILTGEADTILKKKGDQLFSGTYITSGNCEVTAVKVGSECKSHTIIAEAKKFKRAESVLHKNLDRLIKTISAAIVPAGLILFFFQLWRADMPLKDAILKTAAAVIGMIPEGLVVLTTLALFAAAISLSRKNVLVQDYYSIESLARVDVICLDKTGTLTSGRMKVDQVIPLGEDEETLCCLMESFLDEDENPNVTSRALREYFNGKGTIEKTESLPFSSDRKYAAAVLKDSGVCYLGGKDILFPKGHVLFEKNPVSVKEGGRVLVLATAEGNTIDRSHLPEDLKPAGMIVLQDELRENVREIMRYFEEQDVSVRIISGDDPKTVSDIATMAGVKNAENYITMREYNGDYEEIVDRYTVFGRTLPEEKKQLVDALHAKGHTVAMVGDGVNDVPALKAADVSISVGTATAAAKDTANLILINDDFAGMPGIIKEGRRVINNILRSSTMYLVKTIFSVLLVLLCVVMGIDYPFMPIQLTLISSLAVGIPTLILQAEPSFERVSGRSFLQAARKAIPSSIAILAAVIACLILQQKFSLSQERYSALVVLSTFAIYLVTLYRVYSPMTKMRLIVLTGCAVIFAAVIALMPSFFGVEHHVHHTFMLVPLIAGATGIVFLSGYIIEKWIKDNKQ